MIKRDIVFLVYVNRSGSTFLANQLSRHPHIAVAPEGHLALQRLLGKSWAMGPLKGRIDRLISDINEDEKFSSWNINASTLRSNLEGVADEVEALYVACDLFADTHRPSARCVVIKGYFLEGLIRRHGFDALQRGRVVRALFLLRDPRAVFSSQKRTLSTQNGKPMQKYAFAAAVRWRLLAKAVEYLSASSYGVAVRYEDLILENAKTLSELANFLCVDPSVFGSLDSESSVLASLIPEKQRRLHENITKAPLLERIANWPLHLSDQEVAILDYVCGRRLVKFGYKKMDKKLGLSGLLVIFKEAISLLLRKLFVAR